MSKWGGECIYISLVMLNANELEIPAPLSVLRRVTLNVSTPI